MAVPSVEDFLALLFKWNQTYRLTAFKGPEEAMALGVKPSLAILDDLPQGARLLDVGSGGGFPAIPLALLRPDLHVTCTEPSRQKTAFLREAAAAFGLHVQVENVPVEVVLRQGGTGCWDVITVRGVHLRHGLLKRLSKALAPGGVLAVWSGGEREQSYAKWASEAGLVVEERLLPTVPPVPLLLARVPRGT